jgi:hypothetical protein
VNRNSHFGGIFAPVLKKEIDDGRSDGHGKEKADSGNVRHQRVDIRGEV